LVAAAHRVTQYYEQQVNANSSAQPNVRAEEKRKIGKNLGALLDVASHHRPPGMIYSTKPQ
jgi:hypothetical protein